MIFQILVCSVLSVGPFGPPDWEKAIESGREALERKEFASAEAQFRTALTLAEDFKPADPRVVTSLFELGAVLLVQKKYEESEPLFRRILAVETGEKEAPRETAQIDVLEELASTYELRKKKRESERCYMLALALGEHLYGKDSHKLGTTLNNLGALYRNWKPEKGEAVLKRAIAVSENKYGLEHAILAPKLANLAYIYMELERFAEAEPLLIRSINIWKKTPGADQRMIRSRCVPLAKIYARQGKHGEARVQYGKALAFFEATFGKEGEQLEWLLDEFAQLLRKMDEDDEAATLEARAKAIRAKKVDK